MDSDSPAASPETSSAATASYVGAYINLDRSPERRQEMETQLNALGMAAPYVRFRAIDGNTITDYKGPLRLGEVGSFMSHFRALEQLRGAGKCVHIMEDDVLMSRPLAPMIEFAISQGLFDYFDIVFTDVFVAFEALSSIRFHKQLYDEFLIKSQSDFRTAFRALTLESQTFYGLASYIVSAKAIDRLLALFRQEVAAGLTVPNDVFICRLGLERKLRIGYLFPFLTSLRLERALEATVTGRATDRYAMATLGSNLIRYSFFIERDLPGYASSLLDQATEKCVTRPRDAHQDFITRAMEYVVMIDDSVGITPLT